MEINYKPRSKIEKFGMEVYEKIVENFSQTYFVGGMVRDIILDREIKDIDIATNATPSEVAKLFTGGRYACDTKDKQFGTVVVKKGGLTAEVTTLRKDVYTGSRFPKVEFVKSAKADSNRRDFTVNSLYFKPKMNLVLDYHGGLLDIKNKIVRSIQEPNKSFVQDPLRIIRAMRLVLELGFVTDTKLQKAIIKNSRLLSAVSRKRVEKEIHKVSKKDLQKKLFEFTKNS